MASTPGVVTAGARRAAELLTLGAGSSTRGATTALRAPGVATVGALSEAEVLTARTTTERESVLIDSVRKRERERKNDSVREREIQTENESE